MEKKLVNVVKEETALALLCVGYLTFLGFEAHIEQSDVRDLLSQGYYGFFDYAYAYWFRHLEKSTLTHNLDDILLQISETVDVFIDMHWIEPQTKAAIPKSILGRLKPLQEARNFEKVAHAVYAARKEMNIVGKFSPDERVLDLTSVIENVRALTEEMAISTIDKDQFIQMYGASVFKCPRLNCTRFYNGFHLRQLRDEHVPKHERSFFCSFPGCSTALLGCATLKELQKHEMDFHQFTDFDGDEEFPELPAEKPSFDCTQCDAKFTRKHNLTIHMRTHNAPHERDFVCATCGKKFARQGDRTRHESTFHSGPRLFTCGGKLKNGTQWGCGREFNRKDVLARHHRSEKGQNCLLLKQEEEAAEVE